MKANRILIHTFIVIICLSLISTATAEWACWRGPNHDGISSETGLLKQWPEGGPNLLWTVKGLGKGFSTVSIDKGVIYTTGDSDKLNLFAFDISGKELWKLDLDDPWTRSHPGSRSTPTIDDGRIYVLSGNGKLVCVDISSRKIAWSKKMQDFGGRYGGWGYAESVLIHNGMAIVKPGGSNFMVAFDKVTGAEKWRSSGFSSGPEYSSCVPFTFKGTEMIMTGGKDGIVCVSAKTGKVVWTNDFCSGNTANCPDPAYSDGYVFWANGYGKGGICLKLTGSGDDVKADEVWRTKDMVCHHGGYIILDGYIYGNHSGGYACLELKTGKKMWEERGPGKGSLVCADGMLYLFGERGGKAMLAGFSPQGMEVKGEVSVSGEGPSWAHPVVNYGRLYLRYDDNLYCFDVKAK